MLYTWIHQDAHGSIHATVSENIPILLNSILTFASKSWQPLLWWQCFWLTKTRLAVINALNLLFDSVVQCLSVLRNNWYIAQWPKSRSTPFCRAINCLCTVSPLEPGTENVLNTKNPENFIYVQTWKRPPFGRGLIISNCRSSIHGDQSILIKVMSEEARPSIESRTMICLKHQLPLEDFIISY